MNYRYTTENSETASLLTTQQLRRLYQKGAIHKKVWEAAHILRTLCLACSFVLTTTASAADLGKVTVTFEQAPIQLGDQVVARAGKGEELAVIETKGDWYCVLPSRGWIHAKFAQFRPVSADPLATGTQTSSEGSSNSAQFEYSTENGKVTITRYTGPGGAVIIPTSIGGLPVTSIGGATFAHGENRTAITSVTIPASITSIEGNAFSECTGLTSVIIPDSVSTIGISAFSKCTRLAELKISNNVSVIGWSAFGGCESLSSVIIPNSVTQIGAMAFQGCRNLTSVVIGNNVKDIGLMAFAGCDRLVTVTVPRAAKIGTMAFSPKTNINTR